MSAVSPVIRLCELARPSLSCCVLHCQTLATSITSHLRMSSINRTSCRASWRSGRLSSVSMLRASVVAISMRMPLASSNVYGCESRLLQATVPAIMMPAARCCRLSRLRVILHSAATSPVLSSSVPSSVVWAGLSRKKSSPMLQVRQKRNLLSR